MKTGNKMNMDHARIFASELGGKLQAGFFKLFSSEIEEAEMINNQPVVATENRQKTERFLDRN